MSAFGGDWVDRFNPSFRSPFGTGPMASPMQIPGIEFLPPEFQGLATKGLQGLFMNMLGPSASGFLPNTFMSGGDALMQRLMLAEQARQAGDFQARLAGDSMQAHSAQMLAQGMARLFNNGELSADNLLLANQAGSGLSSLLSNPQFAQMLRVSVPQGSLGANMLETFAPQLYAQPMIDSLLRSYSGADRKEFFDAVRSISAVGARGFGASTGDLVDLVGSLSQQGLGMQYGRDIGVGELGPLAEKYAGVLREARSLVGPDATASQAIRGAEFLVGNVGAISPQEMEQKLAGLRQLLEASRMTAKELAAFVQESTVIAQQAGMSRREASRFARDTAPDAIRMLSGGFGAVDSVFGEGTSVAFFGSTEDMMREYARQSASLDTGWMSLAQIAKSRYSDVSTSDLAASSDPVQRQIANMREGREVDFNVFTSESLSRSTGFSVNAVLGMTTDPRYAADAEVRRSAIRSSASMVLQEAVDGLLPRQRALLRGMDNEAIARAYVNPDSLSDKNLQEVFWSMRLNANEDELNAVMLGSASSVFNQAREEESARARISVDASGTMLSNQERLSAFAKFAETGDYMELGKAAGMISKEDLASALLSGGRLSRDIATMSEGERAAAQKAIRAFIPEFDILGDVEKQLRQAGGALQESETYGPPDPYGSGGAMQSLPESPEADQNQVRKTAALDLSGTQITLVLTDPNGGEIVRTLVEMARSTQAGVAPATA